VPDLIDTPNFGDIDHWHLLGGEVALVLDQLHVSGEFLASMPRLGDHGVIVPAGADDDPCFHGWYVQVGYFLTGEVRPYKKSAGTWDRVKPLKTWDQGGPGAWEIALRYSNTDFNSGGILGGMEENYTVGLNWYLNENVRIMWNYVHADVEDVLGNLGVDENLDIFLMRFQVDF
jgi:phosphate-selective porin OprO/OprP